MSLVITILIVLFVVSPILRAAHVINDAAAGDERPGREELLRLRNIINENKLSRK